MIPFLLFIAIIIGTIYFFQPKKKIDLNTISINTDDLEKQVLFFSRLSVEEKTRFIEEVKYFLASVKITGVDTGITETDKLLVASSAVIPVFHFKGWRYYNLQEVLLYSDAIDMNFSSTGQGRDILGMVGTGYLEGKMLLSKPALELGFDNRTDKNNTAIHEFVHLIDKMDGETDGVPKLLMNQQYVIPWLDMIHQEMKKIAANRSDINVYAYTNQTEFFAVVAEYFFERPDLLQQKHPDLYKMLLMMFKQA
ncbi:zinc-dependent peptidase [Ferruginibacter lapsinanis]|uniref:M90 family metallopeptidase n=1 Tax=Ferruginibacter lapsinanis TaxID=563172 RepID=UPI001E2AFCEC|nr:M90 family metallopeptidase [Ferruginibacter lapsinanis]UEG50808.1 zinc-dependent peptidase [Ferruginibacter lapsinanis]